MTETIGKFEKPSAEKFKSERKLLLIPLLYAGDGSPQDYLEKLSTYWRQVEDQINNLESKIGRISKIYFESVSLPGDEGMKIIEKINEKSYHLVKSKCEQGAELQSTEDIELFVESMDWSNCLRVVMGEKAFAKVSELLQAASEKRYEFIARQIDETLKDKEVGALFIREDHAVQFPPNLQVFYVAPPALDDIHRWFRDRASETSKDHP